jgi:glyoxylase-like metal-dependent hydrolase (beta-lactamase superfamily II)
MTTKPNHRKEFIMKFSKQFFSLFITFLFILVPLASADSGLNQLGSVTLFKKGDVTIHSFMAPLKGALVNSQIIETPKKLVVVDVQFVRPYAKALRAYADRLNKPIDRVIVSHGHPDHWFGLEFFTDVPIFALPEVSGMIENAGDIFIKKNRARSEVLFTDKKIVPKMAIKEGKEVIDGLEYEFVKVMNAEAKAQLLIKFPSLGALVVQDLVYNNAHLVIASKEGIAGWKKILTDMKGMTGYDTILVGHGEPATPAVYDDVMQYLDTAGAILADSKTGDEFKNKLMAAYPNHRAAFFINISVGRLFGAH